MVSGSGAPMGMFLWATANMTNRWISVLRSFGNAFMVITVSDSAKVPDRDGAKNDRF